MSDKNHHQLPAGSSSSPRPSPLARWPWTVPHSHRPPSSASSVPSVGTSLGTPWDPRASSSSSSTITATWPSSRAQRAVHRAMGPGHTQDETMRQWAFTAFEWVVRDVRKLKEYLEAMDAQDDEVTEASTFEILQQTPILGDQTFKLEIARIPTSVEAVAGANATPTLSLYITSLMLDYPHADEISASLMAAVKCQGDKVGERGARPDWVWEFWQTEWTFRPGSEVWECALPTLASLMEHPRISETDSFVICIQIHSPTGPFFPQQPSSYYVPRDLLDGLEASLDNPRTGDVRFVCLERQCEVPEATSPSTAHSRRSSSSSSQSIPQVHFIARKRVLYAHSDILIRRSDYFATMLNSSFSENLTSGGRRVFTVIVEEADFVTVYWLLKWVYANWVLFQEEDDPRAAVEGLGTGWSAHWLSVDQNTGEWDWRVVRKPSNSEDTSRDEIGSVCSVRSAESTQRGNAPLISEPPVQHEPAPSATLATSTESPSNSAVASSPKILLRPSPVARPTQNTVSSNPRRATSIITSGRLPTSVATTGPSPSHVAAVHNPPAQTLPNCSHSSYHSLAPRQRQHGIRLASPSPDPHPHPTAAPQAASALSIFQIAHRYNMPGLMTVALDHVMNTITPQSSFPLLLATAVWDELHVLVEDYVVARWDEVSASEAFDVSCQEVAAGEWGPNGGKTLAMLFRRLRSPSSGC